MMFSLLERENLTSIPFDELNGYEKGAVARAFLGHLIKQAALERMPSGQIPGEITVSIQHWQLDLLAHFGEDREPADANEDREILLDKLCQLR